MKKNNPPSYKNARYDIIGILKQPKKVLDVGCNNGATGKLIKEKFQRTNVIGIDYNEMAVNEAKKTLDNAFCCDLDDIGNLILLTSKLDKFDIILMLDVLEHVKYPSEVVRKFFTLLDNEGYIIISLPNTGFYASMLHFLRQKWPRNERGIYDKTHLHCFLKGNLTELCPPDGELSIVSRNFRIKENCKTRFDEILVPIISRIPYIKDFFTFQFICKIQHAQKNYTNSP